MKTIAKVGLVITLVLVTSIIFGQRGTIPVGSQGDPCATTCLSEFESCITDNEINYRISYGGSGNVYVNTYGSFPPGQLTSCVAHYNNCSRTCPSAPTLIINTKRSK